GINPLWSAETGFDMRKPELEWALMPAYWGRGLATELGRALIAYGFEVAGFDHLLAFTSPQHAASIRVMQKIGMRFERRAVFRSEEYVFYRIDRSEYVENPCKGLEPLQG
ncbi:MAG: GNAT family N-acetyltransferase, partial [Chloroflexi bacterium]|nr:GNAT family N-acetyltransferase [Chloroflexota bacterium]